MTRKRIEFDEPLFDQDSQNQDSQPKYNAESESDQEDSDEQLKPSPGDGVRKTIKRDTSRNSYLNKISELRKSEKNATSQEEPKSQNKEAVLKRNRQSAKQCRERKKIYINLLEKKVDELKSEIEASKEQVRTDYNFICKIISDVDPEKMKFLSTKLQLEKKLSEELSKTNLTPDSQFLMEMFLYKYDINGKYKNDLLSFQFENIARLLLDHRLLTYWDSNLVNLSNNCFDMISIDNEHSNTKEKASNLIYQRRAEVMRQVWLNSSILQNIKKIKDEIKDQGDRIQYLTEELAKNLGTQQIVKYLIHPLYVPSDTPDLVKEQSGTSLEQPTIRKKMKM